MLTPFQERIAAIIAGLEEAEGFALAGGGALIVRGDVDRGTRDLDFFGLTTESVNKLAPALERELTAAGMEITALQSNQGFVRLVASQGDHVPILFSKIVPNVKKLGLLDAADGWLRHKYDDIGVIQFEDWADTTEEYGDLDAVAAERIPA